MPTFKHEGYTFAVKHEHDSDMREPWKEHDGHGVVSEWVTRDKQPGERVLARDGGSARYYDIAATRRIAVRDGWGVEHPEGKTKHQIVAEAVESDYQRMRGWCTDEWTWIGVVVTLLDAEGNKTSKRASLWGIESDSGDEYLDEVAGELADDIIAEIGGVDALVVKLKEPEDPGVIQTACRHCGQDIENFAPYPAGEWRDRGSNTHCPNDSGLLHEPVGVKP